MSIKAFHFLFITLSVLLCWTFAYWCLTSEIAEGQLMYQTAGPLALLCGLGLIVYGYKFRQKMRRLNNG
jgi:uncharacterized membrane protein YdjX (TVP38/TMEM64 family)